MVWRRDPVKSCQYLAGTTSYGTGINQMSWNKTGGVRWRDLAGVCGSRAERRLQGRRRLQQQRLWCARFLAGCEALCWPAHKQGLARALAHFPLPRHTPCCLCSERPCGGYYWPDSGKMRRCLPGSIDLPGLVSDSAAGAELKRKKHIQLRLQQPRTAPACPYVLSCLRDVLVYRTWILRNGTSNCLQVGYSPSTMAGAGPVPDGLTVSSRKDSALLAGVEYRGGDYGTATTLSTATLCRDACAASTNVGCFRW